MTPEPCPAFAVVGFVNRGKSSVVSALSADPSVRIDSRSRTTVKNREYPMRVGDRVLYRLIDTPGFENARHMLDWLRQQNPDVSERRETVRRFVQEHADAESFAQECELLRPILDGAGILYVVDGSVPPSHSNEAEMEILLWTMQPRMAIINFKSDSDHSDLWRPKLGQYFQLVRDFDAVAVDFDGRVRLLQSVRELDPAWEAPIDQAVRALRDHRSQLNRQSARRIVRMFREVLTLVLEEKLVEPAKTERITRSLGKRYKKRLGEFEQRMRRDVADLFGHRDDRIVQSRLEVSVGTDLFSEATWSRLGLTRGQFEIACAVSGAALGGAIDAATGGASFFLGTLIGGTSGYAASKFAWRRVERREVFGLKVAGKSLKAGPMNNIQLAWILLDRAILYYRVVAGLSHARRSAVDVQDVDTKTGPVSGLSKGEQKMIQKGFEGLKKGAAEAERDLAERIEDMLEPTTDGPR